MASSLRMLCDERLESACLKRYLSTYLTEFLNAIRFCNSVCELSVLVVLVTFERCLGTFVGHIYTLKWAPINLLDRLVWDLCMMAGRMEAEMKSDYVALQQMR